MQSTQKHFILSGFSCSGNKCRHKFLLFRHKFVLSLKMLHRTSILCGLTCEAGGTVASEGIDGMNRSEEHGL